MLCQNSPGIHLGIGELLISPGNLGELVSFDCLSRSDYPVMFGADRKNVPAIYVSSSDLLCGPCEIIECY